MKSKNASVRKVTQGILLTVLASMIFNLSAIPVGFGQATRVEVVAPSGDITVPTQFTVDIIVVDVPTGTNALYAWEIKLYYNPAVLFWLNATYPPGHVFEGKPFTEMPPANITDADGTCILFTASLQGNTPSFSGSGTLCRITFEAREAGTSTLVFSRPLGGAGDTWLMNYSDALMGYPTIPFTAVDGSVSVVGVDIRSSSAISVDAHPRLVKVDDTITITGAVEVTVSDGTPVYIEFGKLPEPGIGDLPFKLLATVYTVDRQYSYAWTLLGEGWIWLRGPGGSGTFGLWDIRARWVGDDSYKPATSEAMTVKVVGILGDVNSDGKADGKDIAIVAQAFGSYPTHPRWNLFADVNSDSKIDGRDLTIVAKDFGKTYP